MKNLTKCCAASTLFIACSGYAFGFWSWDGDSEALAPAPIDILVPPVVRLTLLLTTQNHHDTITVEGLDKVSYFHESSNETLEFSKKSINKISEENTNTDKGSKKDEPRFHFDNGNLTQSYESLMAFRTFVINNLSKDDPWNPSRLEDAHEYLGMALHLAQDFYSHSTWSDRGNGDIVDFAVTNIPNAQNDAEEVCELGSPHIIITSRRIDNQPRPITTGHYESGRHPLPSREEQKCHHGSFWQHASSLLGCRPTSVEGIAKDDMDCNDRNIEAGRLATEETQAFVQSIVDELGRKNKVDGICALMGIEEINCPDFRITKATYFPKIYGVDDFSGFMVPGDTTLSERQEVYWEGTPKLPVKLVVRYNVFYPGAGPPFENDCSSDCEQVFEEYSTLESPYHWHMHCGPLASFANGYTYTIWLVDSEGFKTNEVEGFIADCIGVSKFRPPFPEQLPVVITVSDRED